MNTVPHNHGKMPDFRDLPLFSSAIAASTAERRLTVDQNSAQALCFNLPPASTAERRLTVDQVCQKVGIPKSELKKCKVQVGGFLELNNGSSVLTVLNSWSKPDWARI
ncbi:MAG: hypothetical protein U7127_05205 [Phormidium sp.]